MIETMMHKTTVLGAFMALILFASAARSQTLTALEFRDRSSAPGAVILDVRSPGEYAKGHIAGAVNINVEDSLFSENVVGLDRAASYFVYCGIGLRSARAARMMRGMGFSRVYELENGLDGWEEYRLPLSTGPMK